MTGWKLQTISIKTRIPKLPRALDGKHTVTFLLHCTSVISGCRSLISPGRHWCIWPAERWWNIFMLHQVNRNLPEYVPLVGCHDSMRFVIVADEAILLKSHILDVILEESSPVNKTCSTIDFLEQCEKNLCHFKYGNTLPGTNSLSLPHIIIISFLIGARSGTLFPTPNFTDLKFFRIWYTRYCTPSGCFQTWIV